VIKQLKDEMEADLSAAQALEQERAATFNDLRKAKTAEIENGERMSEQKEDELATTDNDLAEAKEDLGQETVALDETQKFLANLGTTCAESAKNFDARKVARAEESKAVAQTIQILTEDSARDSMSSTYAFLQVATVSQKKDRRSAAMALRKVAMKTRDPQLAMLATSVELDSFTKVKAAIDDMVSMLKTEQGDEVKKNDWCNSQLQENEMTTAKTEDRKGDLEAKAAQLDSNIKTFADAIAAAHSQIEEQQVNLQRASEDRKAANEEFQKTVADQTVTVEVLKKALDRLANFYDLLQKQADKSLEAGESLLQVKRQTPPVPEPEFKKFSGAEGVMQMIEKLVGDAQKMTKDARKGESEAQAAYEQFVADTNESVQMLQEEIVTKTKHKAGATKDHFQTSADVADAGKEIEGLTKYNGKLHEDCDYVIKNFDVRQQARGEEIEALQQAKQILSGASLS